MTGYTEEELLAMAPVEIFTKESQKIFLKRLSQIIAGEPISKDIVYQCIKKNGDIWWALLNPNNTSKFDISDSTFCGSFFKNHLS